jgi:osmotically-inducible protein OsmY
MSDTTLQRAVMKALADNPHVHADEISVQVIDGSVVLHGVVGSPVQRTRRC